VQLNRLDLNKLHAFFAVVEHDGISGAAARLALTRSAVSQNISGLETGLGLRLFDRIGRKLVLTREGRLLHDRFREYQTVLQKTVDEIVNTEREIRGTIRIGLFLGFPRVRLADFLARFTARHSKASIRVVYAPQHDLDERLLANRLDYVLSFRAKPEAGTRIASTKLFEQELVLAAGARFLRRGFDQKELRRTPFVDYYQSDPLIRRWWQHHLRTRRPPSTSASGRRRRISRSS
jgi:DNA-binding transcriptional LysR family regulator